MDKRTIIALAVIALIFVLMPWYWKLIGFDPGDNPTESSSEAPIELAREGDVSRAGAAAGGEITLPDSLKGVSRPDPAFTEVTVPEQFTTVNTDLYAAVFSSRGASLSSFRLKKFTYANRGDDIEMVPDRELYPLGFQFPETAGISSYGIDFTSSNSRLTLSSAGPESESITFSGSTSGGDRIDVRYTFRRDSYEIGMEIDIARATALAQATRLDLVWTGGLDPTEEELADEYGYFKAYSRQGKEVATFEDFEEGRMQESSSGMVDWVATKSKYFLVAMRRVDTHAEDFSINAVEREAVERGQEINKRIINVQLGNRLIAGTPLKFELYLGPLDYYGLSDAGHDLNKTVEMGFWLFMPFSVAILWFVTTLYGFIPSYGWVIIIFTIVMKAILFPFSRKNYHQMAKMKALQPKLKALQEKFKDDKEKLNQAMLKFYKEEKFNPLGGCIWMLPQLPIFWALFTVFRTLIGLRGDSFLWMSDLSQPNMILALIMAAAMLVQQLLTNKDPKQRFMIFAMPALMFWFFKGFPAGLVLYWTAYNVLSIVEQTSVERSLNLGAEVVPPVEPPARPKRARK